MCACGEKFGKPPVSLDGNLRLIGDGDEAIPGMTALTWKRRCDAGNTAAPNPATPKLAWRFDDDVVPLTTSLSTFLLGGFLGIVSLLH